MRYFYGDKLIALPLGHAHGVYNKYKIMIIIWKMVIDASSNHVIWVELHNVAMVTVTGAGQLVRSDKIYMDRHADSSHGDLITIKFK